MHFAYQGFTHHQDLRRFTFQGIEERNPVSTFCIEVDLPLFMQNGVAVQDGPIFCLQLLTTASLAGPSYLERFHNYRVLAEDFRPLLIERERLAAKKALRKPARRPIPKPPSLSNIQVTSSVQDRQR